MSKAFSTNSSVFVDGTNVKDKDLFDRRLGMSYVYVCEFFFVF